MTRLPSAAYSAPWLVSLLFALPLCAPIIGAAQAETVARPAVEVNLNALKSAPRLVHAPTRIIDGETVIVLTPPSLQKKKPAAPAEKVVTPRVKPALSLSQTDVAAVTPVPVPPVNPAKLPDATEAAKFDTVATPVVKMDTAPIPLPEKAEGMKAEVADDAAEKITEATPSPTPTPTPTTDAVEPAKTPDENVVAETSAPAVTSEPKDEEIQLAAIAPSAGPTVAKAPSASPENLTRILFAENAADLPDDAQAGLQAIAETLKESGRENVQLLAYGSGASVSAARRLSLGRALAVRSKLMELGVDNRQIEVRALGEPEGGGPSDRVDLLLITR